MINIHGGPIARSLPLFVGRSNYLLNELGLAIIYPNVRGSAGFGRKFEQADNGLAREGAIKDIGALLDWIATRSEFDKSRVMLTGASYGGYLTLQAAIEYNDRDPMRVRSRRHDEPRRVPRGDGSVATSGTSTGIR